jgi:hypothetical protein
MNTDRNEAKVEYTYTESPLISLGTYSVAEARAMAFKARVEAPTDGAYRKTDFAIHIEGSRVYRGRMDIQGFGVEGDGNADPIANARRHAEWVKSPDGSAYYTAVGKQYPGKAAERLLKMLEAL